MKRQLFLVAATAALLAGCKDPGAKGDPALGFVRGSTDIVVNSVTIYSAGANSVQGDLIYLVKFTYTNNLGRDFIPQINHFIFEDLVKIRHTGMSTGSPALAGLVSNSDEILKKGASRDYVAGFQVYQNTQGQLVYDPT
ncbi:MAG: hypothetical protein GIW95_08905 [Candidatus Eremiobacteraeota bacterium]|nr:hypothetical protein [Candidatus Eremiobacteraeota bacterium]